MFILSLAITILIGYFLPIWVYKIDWISLIKIATQSGDIETWEEVKHVLNISQEVALRYILIILGLCLLIFIICMSITKQIKKATKRKEKQND